MLPNNYITYNEYYWHAELEQILKGAERRRIIAEAKAAARQARQQNNKTHKLWHRKER